jgi:hypothetical protein
MKDIQNYQLSWKQSVDRMGENRCSKKLLQFKPTGTRDVERPRSRWKDQFWTCCTRNGLDSIHPCLGRKRRRRRRSCWYLPPTRISILDGDHTETMEKVLRLVLFPFPSTQRFACGWILITGPLLIFSVYEFYTMAEQNVRDEGNAVSYSLFTRRDVFL